jgi:hypothetical protein
MHINLKDIPRTFSSETNIRLKISLTNYPNLSGSFSSLIRLKYIGLVLEKLYKLILSYFIGLCFLKSFSFFFSYYKKYCLLE